MNHFLLFKEEHGPTLVFFLAFDSFGYCLINMIIHYNKVTKLQLNLPLQTVKNTKSNLKQSFVLNYRVEVDTDDLDVRPWFITPDVSAVYQSVF